MKSIGRAIDRFCYKHPRFGVPGLMKYVVIATILMYIIGIMDTTGTFVSLLIYFPSAVFQSGEVWRLVTWIICPFGSGSINITLTVISLVCSYIIGTTIERRWGSGKFTFYYLLGVILHVIYATVAWYVFKSFVFLTPVYHHMAMIFIFVLLFPGQTLLLFFVIPLRSKWIALINAGFFAYYIIEPIARYRYYAAGLLPVVALLGFFIVCGDELLEYVRPSRTRASKQAINFKKAAKKAKRDQDHAPYRHKCAVCGKTDVSNPGMEFRYCSRCAGYHCFCADHINSHVHFS